MWKKLSGGKNLEFVNKVIVPIDNFACEHWKIIRWAYWEKNVSQNQVNIILVLLLPFGEIWNDRICGT